MITLVLSVAIADVCARVPAKPADGNARDANAYVAVGDDANTRGDTRVAALAYAKALDADPGNAHARSALDQLCRGERDNDPNAALIAAIDSFQRGDLAAARSQFARIVANGSALAGGAHLFLGLIELAQHAHDRAVTELELAQKDPAYTDAAVVPLRLAYRDGALSALLLAAQEVDSNPQLLPDTPPTGAVAGPPQTDGDLLLASTVTGRPMSWLYLRNVLSWRRQYQLTSLDYFSEAAEAGTELVSDAHHLTLAYTFDYDALAGAPFLFANGVSAAYRRQATRFDLVASGFVRRRDFGQSAYAGFTGWQDSADAGVAWHTTPHLDLEARLVGLRETTDDPTFADWAIGPRVVARTRISSRWRLIAAAAGWYATYDAAEPDGTLRRDVHGEASLDAEYDLGNYWLAICAGQAIVNSSTVADFVYHKLVARCGLAFAWGGP
jgi:hypothetical protein